ncbi:acyltransferase family protein [Polaribacter sp. BM10]|uniref:acyltransferase family protein n=1 Tax=Polaribacter sp. BM10 TaxID=1529069 RepID=UPI0020C7E288|nr:acyltransferase family protein [Polaribacter sp. BM10]
MLLGLVLHSALTYNVTNHGNSWGIKDPESNYILTDFLVLLIHSFRMPIFFLVAGFFGSMLFYERGIVQMLKNRISRIVFPFIVFLFILSPIIYFTFSYTNAIFENQENPLATTSQLFSNIIVFLPKTTAHLWFLYYLIHITLISVLLGLLLTKSKQMNNKVTKSFNWLIKRPVIRVLFFSSITFFMLTFLETSMVNASVSFIPDVNTFVFYFFFYIIGWILFKSKNLLYNFKKYDWQCTFLAIFLIIMQGLLIQYSGMDLNPNSNSGILILFNSVIVWLFIFGITGLFIRYSSKYSKRMRYISDSSYWVYLIHLPLTAIIPAFIWEFPLPTLVKFTMVLFLTTLICFVTYHYLVRNTFIGKFLNGKKYPKKDKGKSSCQKRI